MIIFIYGPDTFRSREKLHEVIGQFQTKRDQTGMNVVRLDGDNFDFNRFRQEVLTQGFLSPRKMIVISDLLSKNQAETLSQVFEFLKKDLSKQTESNVVVFWEADLGKKKSKLKDYLKKQKYVYEFQTLPGSQLESWLGQRIRKQDGQIPKLLLKKIIFLLGNDTWLLANETDKLIAFANERQITEADISTVINPDSSSNIFALTDALAAQNKQLALKLLTTELQQGSHELYLLSMITRQFRILLQVKDYLNQGEVAAGKIAKELKLHPFVVQKSLAPAKRFKLDQLKNIYRRLLETDLKLKSTSLNPQLLLDLLIIE